MIVDLNINAPIYNTTTTTTMPTPLPLLLSSSTLSSSSSITSSSASLSSKIIQKRIESMISLKNILDEEVYNLQFQRYLGEKLEISNYLLDNTILTNKDKKNTIKSIQDRLRKLSLSGKTILDDDLYDYQYKRILALQDIVTSSSSSDLLVDSILDAVTSSSLINLKRVNEIGNNDDNSNNDYINSDKKSKIMKYNGVYTCKLCSFESSTIYLYDAHCMTKMHRTCVLAATPEEIAELPPYRTVKTFLCKACDFETRKKNRFIIHCETNKHKKMPGIDVDQSYKPMLRCFDCKFAVEERKLFEEHIKSPLHINRLSSLQICQKERFKVDNIDI
jgi:hypothetical protein